MHQDRKPTAPGIVQKPKKSMSHKEQSPGQLDPTTAQGLTLARVRIPFPPTGAAGGAAAREFPWGLSPSWYVTISAHLDSILVPSCSEGLRAPNCCPQVSRSNTQVQHSGIFSPPPLAIPGFSPLLIDAHLVLWLHSSLLPNPVSICPQSSIHLSSLCPF